MQYIPTVIHKEWFVHDTQHVLFVGKIFNQA